MSLPFLLLLTSTMTTRTIHRVYALFAKAPMQIADATILTSSLIPTLQYSPFIIPSLPSYVLPKDQKRILISIGVENGDESATAQSESVAGIKFKFLISKLLFTYGQQLQLLDSCY
jgi:hypothetical protein